MNVALYHASCISEALRYAVFVTHSSQRITQFYLPPTHKPYLPLFPSRKVSSPFGWYSLRLPTKGWPGWVYLGGWLHTEIMSRTGNRTRTVDWTRSPICC